MAGLFGLCLWSLKRATDQEAANEGRASREALNLAYGNLENLEERENVLAGILANNADVALNAVGELIEKLICLLRSKPAKLCKLGS